MEYPDPRLNELRKKMNEAETRRDLNAILEAATSMRELGTPDALAVSKHAEGMHANISGDSERAIALYDECAAMHQANGNDFGYANALLSAGMIYISTNVMDVALERVGLARQIFDSLGAKQKYWKATSRLADVYQWTGENAQALKYYRQCIEFHEATGEEFDAVLTMHNMAMLLFKVDQPDESIRCFEKCVEVFTESKTWVDA